MPNTKNKPKRLDQQRSWRVGRRKKQLNEFIHPTGKTRRRPKNKVNLMDEL